MRKQLPFSVLLITGMSGSGKSFALTVLEDLGYESIDNLPLSLLPQAVHGDGRSRRRPLAIDTDARTRDFDAHKLLEEVQDLKQQSSLAVQLVFVDCDDDVVARRFTETRRRHPLAVGRPLMDGIHHERRLLKPLHEAADLLLDTSLFSVKDFRSLLHNYFTLKESRELVIFITSFSYRYGLPREADIVFDARLLDNPYYVQTLRPLTGMDAPIQEYIQQDKAFDPFLQSVQQLLETAIPKFKQEGRSYLTIAFGCTGGKHRSVFMAETIASWLREKSTEAHLSHRDVHRKK